MVKLPKRTFCFGDRICYIAILNMYMTWHTSRFFTTISIWVFLELMKWWKLSVISNLLWSRRRPVDYLHFLMVRPKALHAAGQRLTSSWDSYMDVATTAPSSANSRSRMTLYQRSVLTLKFWCLKKPPLVRNLNLTPVSMSPKEYLSMTENRAKRKDLLRIICNIKLIR